MAAARRRRGADRPARAGQAGEDRLAHVPAPPRAARDASRASGPGASRSRASSSRRRTTSSRARPRRSSSRSSWRPSAQLVEAGSPLRALEEPDAIRRADHRLDGREGGLRAGGAAARVRGDLQPAARADAARDRRDAALRAPHPADGVDQAVAARQRQPLQHAQAARACRRPRSRTPAWPRSRPPRIPAMSTTSTSFASRTRSTTSSPRARPSSIATRPSTATSDRRRHEPRRAARPPGRRLALAADAERGVRCAGLDWAYVALDVEPAALRDAVAGLVAGGYAGANVTIPHKQRRGRALRRGRRRVGQHARLSRRPHPRLQHRPGDRGRDRGARRAACSAPAGRRRRCCRRSPARCVCSREAATGRPMQPAAT